MAGSVVEASTTSGRRTPERAAVPPAASPYTGLLVPALGATPVDSGRMPERALGPF